VVPDADPFLTAKSHLAASQETENTPPQAGMLPMGGILFLRPPTLLLGLFGCSARFVFPCLRTVSKQIFRPQFSKIDPKTPIYQKQYVGFSAYKK
jgi:hypothetical protein